MSAWPFYLAYLMPVSAVAGYLLGGAFAFSTLFLAFVIIPLLDLFVAPDRTNPTPEETEALAHRLSLRVVTNLYAVVQVALVIWGAYVVIHTALSTIELIGLILSIAITTGGIGITVAHELCHKKNFIEKTLGKTGTFTSSTQRRQAWLRLSRLFCSSTAWPASWELS